MTASRSGLGPASGGDALESVTGKDRSNNDVKQPLTRLVVNFYRTVVACAKKPGAKKHTPPSRPARCESSRLNPLPQLCGQPSYRVAANRPTAPMPSPTVTRPHTSTRPHFAPHLNPLQGSSWYWCPPPPQRSTPPPR